MQKCYFLLLYSLIYIIKCEYVELDPDSLQKYRDGDVPILVKFYVHDCIDCIRMAKSFLKASKYFSDIDFGGIDCFNYEEVCYNYRIKKYPKLRFFEGHSNPPIEVHNYPTVEGIFSFMKSYRQEKPSQTPSKLINLHPYNFESFYSNNKCAFTMFHQMNNTISDFLYPQMNVISRIYEPESNISIGVVDCKKYDDICKLFKITRKYPEFLLFKENDPIPFHGKKNLKNFVNFINQNCGTDRGVDGLLSDDAGLIPEAGPLVYEFVNKFFNKKKVVKRMKNINGTEIYVSVMKRILTTGIKKLENDVKEMKKVMEERKCSMKTLDQMKIKYNICQQFLHPELLCPDSKSDL